MEGKHAFSCIERREALLAHWESHKSLPPVREMTLLAGWVPEVGINLRETKTLFGGSCLPMSFERLGEVISIDDKKSVMCKYVRL